MYWQSTCDFKILLNGILQHGFVTSVNDCSPVYFYNLLNSIKIHANIQA